MREGGEGGVGGVKWMLAVGSLGHLLGAWSGDRTRKALEVCEFGSSL